MYETLTLSPADRTAPAAGLVNWHVAKGRIVVASREASVGRSIAGFGAGRRLRITGGWRA